MRKKRPCPSALWLGGAPHPLRFKVVFCADRDLSVQKKRPKPSEPDRAIHNIELRGGGGQQSLVLRPCWRRRFFRTYRNREQDRETHVSVNVTAPARRRAHVNAHRVRAVARAFSQVVSTSRCRLAAYGGPDTMASGRFRLLPAYGGPDTMASDMRVGRRQV